MKLLALFVSTLVAALAAWFVASLCRLPHRETWEAWDDARFWEHVDLHGRLRP